MQLEFIFRVFRGEGNETRRAEVELGFLGRKQPAPLHQLEVWEYTPSGVRNEAPAEIDLGAFAAL